MSGEPLCEEQVPRSPIHICYRRVSERVEGIKSIETGDKLPRFEKSLDATLGDPLARLIAEEGS